MRRKLATIARNRRNAVGATQEEVGQRLDPGAKNANAYVSRIERTINDSASRGDFSIYGWVNLCAAIDPAWSLSQALIDAQVESGRGHTPDSTIAAITADPLLRPHPVLRRALAAAVRQVYEDDEREANTPARRAQRRDDAKTSRAAREDAVATLTDGWEAEERERLLGVIELVERAQRNRSRARSTKKNGG